MPEVKDGCVKPARGPIAPQSTPQETKTVSPEVKKMFARVGQEAGQVTLKPGPSLVGKVWQVWKPKTG